MAWLGFFLLVAVIYICDSWLFSQGYNTFWHGHKTPEEKTLQQLVVAQRRAEVVKTYHEGGYSPPSGSERPAIP